ncbi:MAG: hypothetical protein AAF501_13370 [Pseudomonadota bacterium]
MLALSGAACSEDASSSDNLIINGSFEQTESMKEADFGFKGEIPGWISIEPIYAEIVRGGVADMPAADGSFWLDTGQSADSVIRISQAVLGLTSGAQLKLVFHAGQWREPSEAPDETLNVYWNGDLVASVRPEAVSGYEKFEFDLVAGTGDGSDTLRFDGVSDGSKDHQGVALDNIVLTEADSS